MKKMDFISTPLWTIAGRVGGLLVPFFIALWFGAGAQTDAFFLSYGLIISLNGIFNPIFESLLVPYLAEHKNDPKKMSGISNSIILAMAPLMIGLSLLVGVLLPVILKHSSGLDDASSQLTARLFFEMIPLFLFGVLVSASNGIFYTHKVFWFPAFSPSIRFAVVLMILFAAHSHQGIHSVTWGYGIGEIFRWFLGIMILRRESRWHFSFSRNRSQKGSEIFKTTLFQILALLALNLIPLVNQWFASWFGAGKLSLLSYADRLFQIPYQLFMTGMLQIYLSYWSEDYYAKGSSVFWEKAKRHIALTAKIALGFSLVLFFLRGTLVQIIFGSSRIPPDQLATVSSLFGWLILGFLPCVLNLLYVRVLFVMKKTAAFCFQSWARLILNVILNYFFVQLFGLQGIAISTGLVAAITSLVAYIYIKSHRASEKKAVS